MKRHTKQNKTYTEVKKDIMKTLKQLIRTDYVDTMQFVLK